MTPTTSATPCTDRAHLRAAQQALLQAVLGPAGEAPPPLPLRGQPERGLLAYRSHGRALAERVLAAAYPVVQALLGEESFAALARGLWHRHPPGCGDMGLWGDALPAWLDQDPQLRELPYLGDVARVEWALHRCASAADAMPDPASLQLLLTQDPAELGLRLAPGTVVLESPWPVVSLVQAHQACPAGAEPDLGEAAARLRAGQGDIALVWREGFVPRLRRLDAAEARLLPALLRGAPLAQAVADAPGLDFAHWLSQALHSGLLCGALHRPPPVP